MANLSVTVTTDASADGNDDADHDDDDDDTSYPRPIPHPTTIFRQTSFFAQILSIAAIASIAGPQLRAQYSLNLNLRQPYLLFSYGLVLFNCLISFSAATANILAVFLIIPSSSTTRSTTPFFFLTRSKIMLPHEQSLIRYYDHVLQKSFDERIDFFHFAYVDLLGPEFERKLPPKWVCRYYAEMLEYLYAHRLGLDALDIYLDYADPSVREAAANMPGFWLSEGTAPRILAMVRTLPESLVKKLVKKLGQGQVGWAAANSIAAKKPDIILLRRASKKESKLQLWPWADLVAMVDPQSERSLVILRALVDLVQSEVKEGMDLMEEWGEVGRDLQEKLLTILKLGDMKLHRVRVVSAYLLLLLNAAMVSKKLVLSINPQQDKYWLSSEKEMLRRLRSACSDRAEDEAEAGSSSSGSC